LWILETATSSQYEYEQQYAQEEFEEKPQNRALGRWLIPIGLVLLAVVLYAGAFNFERLYSWDDNRYLNENDLIRDLSPQGIWNLTTQRYFAANIPVTLFSYAIEYHLWGLESSGYHVTNVILHALNGLLVYYFLARLLKNRAVALLAAIIWIVHPVQVESIAWISQRKNLLSMLFTLLAFLAHMSSAEEDAPRRWLPIAWVMYLLAAFAKPAVVGVPVLFMAYDFFYARKSIRQTILRNIVPLAIGIASALLIVLAHDEGGGIKAYRGDSFFTTFQIMLIVYWDYLVALIAPTHLDNYYIYNLITLEQNGFSVILGLLLLIVMIIIALRSIFRWMRTGEDPFGLFAILWIVLFMLPVSNIIPIAIERADRYMYFPTVVVFAVIGMLMVRLWAWGEQDVRVRHVLSGLVVAIILPLVILTGQRIPVWESSKTLWEDHLADNETSQTGWLNLGVYYFNTELYDSATPVFDRLLELNPRHFKGNRFVANIALAQGRYNDALPFYQRAIQANPSDGLTYHFVGQTYLRMGDNARAAEAFRRAVELDPALTASYPLLGQTARRAGELELARDALTVALQNNPNNLEIASELCLALAALGDIENALSQCQRTVQAEPQNATYLSRFAQVLALNGQSDDALQASQQAVELAATAETYRVLGEVLADRGEIGQAVTAIRQAGELATQVEDYSDAIRHFQAALNYNASDALTYVGLAKTYVSLNQPDTALETFRRALDISPDSVEIYLDFGGAARRHRDYELARDVLMIGYQVSSSNVDLLIELCGVMADLEEYQLAVDFCRQSVQLSPDNGFAYGLLAHILLLNNQPEEALPAAQRAAELSPDRSLSFRVLGDALSGTGNNEQAITAYQQAVALDPNNRLAVAQLESLAN
jgi:tetratricopeptide (TPR) repeat protein